MPLLFISLYSVILITLVWARYCYFDLGSSDSKIAARIYDPLVGIHIIASYYYSNAFTPSSSLRTWLSIFILLLGGALFVHSARTAKKLDFAFSDQVSTLIIKGPFAIVRHPFYISYMLIWLSSSLLFNSTLLWITLFLLIAFYIFSAKREEEVILKSSYSREYRIYRNRVGMFLPRILQWKNWILEILRKLKNS